MKATRRRNGVIAFEYMILFVLILSAILVFHKYIIRSFAGGWAKAGDVFGHGQQYDPRLPGGGGSDTCAYLHHYGAWVNDRCYDACAGGGMTCVAACPCTVAP